MMLTFMFENESPLSASTNPLRQVSDNAFKVCPILAHWCETPAAHPTLRCIVVPQGFFSVFALQAWVKLLKYQLEVYRTETEDGEVKLNVRHVSHRDTVRPTFLTFLRAAKETTGHNVPQSEVLNHVLYNQASSDAVKSDAETLLFFGFATENEDLKQLALDLFALGQGRRYEERQPINSACIAVSSAC